MASKDLFKKPIIKLFKYFKLNREVGKMGKFPEADKEILNVVVCLRCKTRNKKGAKKCRKCHSKYLRPKSKEVKSKK